MKNKVTKGECVETKVLKPTDISESKSVKVKPNSVTSVDDPKDADSKRVKSESMPSDENVNTTENGNGDKSWIPGSEKLYAAREMVENGYKNGKEKAVEAHQYLTNTKEVIVKTAEAYKGKVIEKVTTTRDNVYCKRDEVNKKVSDTGLKAQQWLKGDCNASKIENILVKTTSVLLSVSVKMTRFGLRIIGLEDATKKKLQTIHDSVQEKAASVGEKYPSIAGYKDVMLEYWPVRLVDRVGRGIAQQVFESI